MSSPKGRERRSPWARIYLAVQRGTGVRLSAEDVLRLGGDGALMTRGEMDFEGTDDSDPRPATFEHLREDTD